MKLVSLLSVAALAGAAQLPLYPHKDAFAHPAASLLPASPDSFSEAEHAFTSASIDDSDDTARLFATFANQEAGMPDVTYEILQHSQFPNYRMRIRRPQQLCDPDVVQYSGYLDVARDKHLFFWFFESRSQPSDSPLVLWLNGGPGCSSSTGLLFELGPCSIRDGGKTVSYNPHSWNSRANMIFLDQPVNVGYSYSENSTVFNTPDAAEDVYAFLQLFVHRFEKYSKLPFHVAAESFGGRYAPLIASSVHNHNKNLAMDPIQDVLPINLHSVLIGNGVTELYTQLAAIPEYACHGPFPLYDPEDPRCAKLKEKTATCQKLIKTCYTYDTKATCLPASLYCLTQLEDPIAELGLNVYDVRKKCNRDQDGGLCYKELDWIETWMNKATVRAELGVNEAVTFSSCNMAVSEGFLYSGDSIRNSAALIPEMLAEGIRFLIYAGNADYMCNFIGNEQWMLNLNSTFQAELQATPPVDYRTLYGKIAGKVRAAGGSDKHFGAGNFTYVQVYDAGHMVPFDQPEVALDMFVRWISDVSLIS